MEFAHFMCPKCGKILMDLFHTGEEKKLSCNYCSTQMLILPYSDQQFSSWSFNEREKIYNEFLENTVKKEEIFDQELFNKRVYEEEHRPINSTSYIHCPNCKSTQVQRISTANKIGSAALFGVFAIGHVGKSYKCKTCKYEW